VLGLAGGVAAWGVLHHRGATAGVSGLRGVFDIHYVEGGRRRSIQVTADDAREARRVAERRLHRSLHAARVFAAVPR
jgi:hypothetical protein